MARSGVAANRTLAEASARLRTPSRRMACTRTARSELHQISSRSARGGASSRRCIRPRPDWPPRSPPLGSHGRSCEGPLGYPRAGCESSCRSDSVYATGSRELPPTGSPPRWFTDARHAAWEFDDSSHGVRAPSAFEPRRSSCRLTSPTPSALRVSHPLSGLLPPGPRGFVSRHIRPWGLVTAFRAFPTQPAVAPLDARCSPAVSADFGFSRASSRWAVAPAFGHPTVPWHWPNRS
jgi:hypothetical protein